MWLVSTSLRSVLACCLNCEWVICVFQGTDKGDKNEILYKHGINYNEELEIFRKGSVFMWAQAPVTQSETDSAGLMLQGQAVTDSTQQAPQKSGGKTVVLVHEDIIGEAFWTKYPNILI